MPNSLILSAAAAAGLGIGLLLGAAILTVARRGRHG